ncbi:MAG: homocysteine S-methyltransferase family protein [Candidatus Edwardsbacteria bacterium]|nr:homocysteine S-methyltransferase family protein [Candidatus Edwardsbacteria bacterium]MBU2462535.1 homocysteine S-methyltransferase family protein [Candidatus Edwardsbacteria bacterium]MBU2595050.1 homocysteine S-methyltransferase family protein [Candidatus Edwardsbacteria bacterium]
MSSQANLLDQARSRILIFDGAMGTYLKELGLTVEDYKDRPGCNEYLVVSRPDLVSRVHRDYLAAGADIIETDTFGGAPHILADYGLEADAFEINKTAASLARRAADEFSTARHPRFVAGSMGPGSKIPSLGQVSFDDLKESYSIQAEGLLAGGIDCFLVETCQDILQAKAAVSAAREVQTKRSLIKPILVQFTIDQSGRTLTGSDISAILASIETWAVDAIGLNCSLGPEGLAEAVYYLGHNSSKMLSLLPNAGLPRMKNGQLYYDLGPEQFTRSMEDFAKNPGLNFAGGCCGTNPGYIKMLAERLKNIPPRRPVKMAARISSLYQSQDIAVSPKPLLIGERTNASGSKAFRDLLDKNDHQGMAEMACQQEQEGAHAIDLSLARPGRNESDDYRRLCFLLNTRCRLPVMIDSTDPMAVEAALKNLSGRSIINSINLEDGGAKAKKILTLCREYGAAVVCLTIDEKGMAQTADRKVTIAKRLAALALEHGLSHRDIFFDTLTFTLGSGDRTLTRAGLESLEAIKELKKILPDSFTILGVSNISYGLPQEARKALNSVFLQRAISAGLDAAIIHPGKIMPLNQIPRQVLELCDDLIFDRRKGQSSPLELMLNYFSGRPERALPKARLRKLTPKKQIQQNIIRGEEKYLRENIAILLEDYGPVEILDQILLPAMDQVGKLFGQGEMQLPFVLRSAEVMQQAVDILKPYLKGRKTSRTGIIVIATVRGDIHDIGKNLAGLILSANGYKVIDLGIRQTAEDILLAVKKHKPIAIGLSGLLVESARAMSEYLEVFARAGVDLPVLCGGAALNEAFVKKELQPLYPGKVFYARDAMAGLKIVQALSKKSGRKKSHVNSRVGKPSVGKISIIKNIPIEELLNLVDKRALFQNRWQMVSKMAGSIKKKQQTAEAQKTLNGLMIHCLKGKIFEPKVVRGVFQASWDKPVLKVFCSSETKTVDLNFSGTLADRFFNKHTRNDFIIGLQAVTLGGRIKKEFARLKKQKKIRDQFLLYGLSAELAEGLAKWAQEKTQRALRLTGTKRLSPGYPVWPALSEQKKIFMLLKPQRVGVRLSASWQMDPEFSTSAIVIK